MRGHYAGHCAGLKRRPGARTQRERAQFKATIVASLTARLLAGGRVCVNIWPASRASAIAQRCQVDALSGACKLCAISEISFRTQRFVAAAYDGLSCTVFAPSQQNACLADSRRPPRGRRKCARRWIDSAGAARAASRSRGAGRGVLAARTCALRNKKSANPRRCALRVFAHAARVQSVCLARNANFGQTAGLALGAVSAHFSRWVQPRALQN